jgi:hypothetical protein
MLPFPSSLYLDYEADARSFPQVSERLLSNVKYCDMRQEVCTFFSLSPLFVSELTSPSLAGGASDHIPLVLDIEESAVTGSTSDKKEVDEVKADEAEEKPEETEETKEETKEEAKEE